MLHVAVTQCANGSPKKCKAEIVPISGYSAGALIKITNGREVRRSTEANSCPPGWKIWSPRTENDWTLVYNGENSGDFSYPENPHLIVDVTRDQDGCGGCGKYAMKSGVLEQSSWRTSDGSAWWLRDTKWDQQKGENYEANCYIRVANVNPKAMEFKGRKCKDYVSDYFCQPTRVTASGI